MLTEWQKVNPKKANESVPTKKYVTYSSDNWTKSQIKQGQRKMYEDDMQYVQKNMGYS